MSAPSKGGRPPAPPGRRRVNVPLRLPEWLVQWMAEWLRDAIEPASKAP